MQLKFDWLVVLENLRRGITELEGLRMKQRLLINPNDAEALAFFAVLDEWNDRSQQPR